MLTEDLARTFKEKFKNIYVLFFFVIMIFLGIFINNFEPYPKFDILFPVLLVMSFSTIMVLRHCLKQMLDFKELCQDTKIFNSALKILFAPKKNFLIILIYVLVMIMYFISLYNLQFISLNIMGFYILIWGTGTLGMALVAYETYIRLTIVLSRVASDNISLSQNYNVLLPYQTNWLQSLYQLSKMLKNASLVMGLLFVFENTMIFYANINILNTFIGNTNLSVWAKAKELPLEFWIIWFFVFIAIALAFPIIAITQSSNTKKIINKIELTYSNMATLEFKNSTEKKQILDYYIFMMMIRNIELSLNEKYMPQKFNKFIVFLASFLTCILHLTTLYNLFI